MTQKYPKYVRRLSDKLYYQRDFPTRLQRLLGAHKKKTFTRPLGSAENRTELSLQQEITSATEAFALHCKMLETSDPGSFDQSELDRAATEYLRRSKLTSGQFVADHSNRVDIRRTRREGLLEEPDNMELANRAIPEIENIRLSSELGFPLAFEEEVAGHAWRKLVEHVTSKPNTLSQLWIGYANAKGIDNSTRDGKRKGIHWTRWLSIAGDTVISANTINQLHTGLDRYVEEREIAEIKGQSIKRELNEVLAVLRWASRKYRYGWAIEAPTIKVTSPVSKSVLQQHEQIALVEFCLSEEGRTHAETATTILLMLQCGGMPSEIARLTEEKVALDQEIPHIVISGQTKTRDRERVVPIVIGKEYISKNISKALRWLNSSTDSAHSHRIKRMLQKASGNDRITGHGLRHTFRANSEANGASSSSTAAIGGWSGASIGLSNIMLQYGAEGRSTSEGLKALYLENRKIHRHLESWMDE